MPEVIRSGIPPTNFFTFSRLSHLAEQSQTPSSLGGLKEMFVYLKRNNIRHFHFIKSDAASNQKLEINILDLPFREDFDHLMRLVSANPLMQDPREYGLPYQPERYAGFVWVLGSKKLVDEARLWINPRTVLVRGCINRYKDN